MCLACLDVFPPRMVPASWCCTCSNVGPGRHVFPSPWLFGTSTTSLLSHRHCRDPARTQVFHTSSLVVFRRVASWIRPLVLLSPHPLCHMHTSLRSPSILHTFSSSGTRRYAFHSTIHPSIRVHWLGSCACTSTWHFPSSSSTFHKDFSTPVHLVHHTIHHKPQASPKPNQKKNG